MRISRVVGAGRHPRRAGFRDGLLAAAVVVALALAAGVLSIGGGTTGVTARASSGSSSSAEPASGGATVARGLTPSASGAGGVAAGASLPAIPALTLVYVVANRTPVGTDMVDGCAFLFDFGVDAGGRRYRACPGAEGPTGPLGVVDAPPGARLLVEYSLFTPSTRPALPAVACGHLSAPAGAFVEDPSCRVSYSSGTSYEFGFGLPDARGRWVIAVRGCVAGLVTECGAWYAEVDTLVPAPAG